VISNVPIRISTGYIACSLVAWFLVLCALFYWLIVPLAASVRA
jgi:hypothetical protein